MMNILAIKMCQTFFILVMGITIAIQYSWSWETQRRVSSPFKTFKGPYGLKQCLKECLRRKACLTIGYNYRHLSCELSSMAVMEVTNDIKSIVVSLSSLSLYEPLIGQCVNHSCDDTQICVPLTSGSAACVISDLGYYYISDEMAVWSDALDECKQMGGHLVKVDDQSENDWIITLTEHSAYWIGANDILVEGTFVWESDSSSASFTSWNPSEPNNHNNEDCVGILKSGGWNDYPCQQKLKFICEID